MHIPYYGGFYFSHKKCPEHGGHWWSCKEDAGRFISKYAKTSFLVYYGAKNLRNCKKKLQARLRRVSKALGVEDEITVQSIKGESHVLRVSIPKEWLRHRVSTHLYLTYVRRHLLGMSSTYDTYHLQNAGKLIRYAKKLGLKKFNTHMKKLTGYPRMRGVVEANNRMRQHSRSKIYKEA